MVRWRVGTLSMGISLIALGVILLIALLGGYGIVEQLFKWWPILLIVIGGEILLYIFRAEEQAKVKYDVFSIFMIMVIFVTSGIFYGITSTNILQQVTANIKSRDYSVMISQQEVKIGEDVKKIVINIPSRATLDVNKTEGKKLIYKGNAEVFTNSIETATEIVNGKEIHISEVEGTLYLQFPMLERRQDFKTGVTRLNYEVFIPEGVDVEFKGNNHHYSEIILSGDAVSGNWWISGSSHVLVNGKKRSNFELEVVVEEPNYLKGNVEWETKEQEDGYTVGKTIFGEGTHKLMILKGYVEAINIP